MTDEDRREDLRRLYGIAIDEYRFQVQLNNQRFQWYTALDVALLTVGTGLLRISEGDDGTVLTALVFVVGALLAAFTAITVARQVDYQHQARATAKKIAAELGLTEYEIGSTPGWEVEDQVPEAKKHQWLPKVRYINYGLLAILGLIHLFGAYYVLVMMD